MTTFTIMFMTLSCKFQLSTSMSTGIGLSSSATLVIRIHGMISISQLESLSLFLETERDERILHCVGQISAAAKKQ